MNIINNETIYATDKYENKLCGFNILRPTLIYLVGLPASGKSNKALELASAMNAVIHSSDSIREELGNINSQDNNELVFKILHGRIFSDLYEGKNVIYDATNVKSKTRVSFLKQLQHKKISCKKICVVMATPYEDCIVNNRSRDRCISDEVITRMYKNFEMPSTFEGFDDVEICYSRDNYPEYVMSDVLYSLLSVSHDNPHHTYSIGEHCFECQKQMAMKLAGMKDCEFSRNMALSIASQIHDIGKGIVKEFKNSKGETTETAHYYQHHCVGAYNSMFYLNNIGLDKDLFIRIILLVNHHMKPFDWEHSDNPDKAIRKFKTLYGEEFYDDIMLLHECDLKAH